MKLSGALKRALSQENRDLDPKAKRQKVAGTLTQSEAQTDHAIVVDDLDVPTVQENGELDEAEDKLCHPSAQLETGNNTHKYESLLKEIQHEYEEEDCVWEKVRNGFAGVRFLLCGNTSSLYPSISKGKQGRRSPATGPSPSRRTWGKCTRG